MKRLLRAVRRRLWERRVRRLMLMTGDAALSVIEMRLGRKLTPSEDARMTERFRHWLHRVVTEAHRQHQDDILSSVDAILKYLGTRGAYVFADHEPWQDDIEGDAHDRF